MTHGYQIGVLDGRGGLVCLLADSLALDGAEAALAGFELSILAPGFTPSRALLAGPAPDPAPHKSP